MKGFTTLVLVVIAATAVLGQIEQDISACKAKVHATHVDVTQVKAAVTPTTRAGACLLACIHQKSGMMDKDNKIDMKVVRKLMEPLKEENFDGYKKLMKYHEECKAEEKVVPDKCIAAKNFNLCISNKKKRA